MFDSVSHMIFICLIVVGLRVVWISVLAYTCVRAWRVFSAVETKTIALLKECFGFCCVSSRFLFLNRWATEKIGWVWYVYVCECMRESEWFYCLVFIASTKKRKKKWNTLETVRDWVVWLLLLLLLMLLLHNFECYRTIGTEKEERIEENPVYSLLEIC